MKEDKTGNSYIETEHTRVTLVKNRPSSDKDWTAGPAIRVQAIQGSGRLHIGAEIPLADIPDILKASPAC